MKKFFSKLIKLLLVNRIETEVYILEQNARLPVLAKKIESQIEISQTGKLWRKKYCYNVYNNDHVLMHTSVLFFSNLLAFQIGMYNSCTIGDCVTHSDFRGLNLYPITLQRVIKDYVESFSKKRKELIVFVHPDNGASINGIKKAGFTYKGRYIVTRYFTFFYSRKKIG